MATSDRSDERDLVRRVQSGDGEAYATLVRRYVRRAFTIAYRLLGHREDAEDLVQEAFLTALAQIGTCDPGRPFGPWFLRIVVNRGLNARKARHLRVADALPDELSDVGESPERSIERADIRDRVRAAVERLPQRQRLIIELFELEGFSSVEIAELLDMNEGAVRWHVYRARQLLRPMLAPLREECRE